ncbi:MAG: DUF898 family protein [Pseudomonadota bacterium]
MTSETENPGRSWDLENFRVGKAPPPDPKARGKGRASTAGPDITEQDDGEWLAPGERKARARYVDGGRVFWIGFFGVLLSIFTVGLYRFWMLTNLRRAYAGSVRVENDPIEYTGTGLEKLIGFLVAVAMLAIYLSMAQFALTFAGVVSFDMPPQLLGVGALLAIGPFWYWAQYRSQKYIMSRLRWRGIRFGLEKGALRYMGLSLLWGVATLASLGFLYPYMHFKQAQFIANRTHIGSLKVTQHGSWLGLLSYWIWFYIAIGMMFLFVWGMAEEMRLGEEGIGLMIGLLAPLAFLIFFIMYMNYQAGAFRYLWDNRTIGGATLENDLSSGGVIWTYIKGSVLTSILTTLFGSIGGLIFLFIGLAVTSLLLGEGGSPEAVFDELNALWQDGTPPEVMTMLVYLPAALGFFLTYIVGFAISFGFTQSLVIQPIMSRKVEAVLMRNPGALERAKQRSKSEADDAGGFADALGVDLGGGF